MEDIISELMKECHNNYGLMDEEINSIINQSKYRIVTRLTDVIRESVSFINENHIVNTVFNSYLPLIKSRMKKVNEKCFDNLMTATKSLESLANSGRTREQLASIMSLRVNEASRRLNPEVLSDINQEFANSLTKELMRKLEDIPSISQRDIDNLYYELRPAIKNILNKESSQLFDTYERSLSTSSTRFLSSVNDKLAHSPARTVHSADFSKVRKVVDKLAFLGIEVYDLFDNLQVKDANGKYIQMFDDGKGLLTPKDDSFSIEVNGLDSVTYTKEDKVITYDANRIIFGYKKSKSPSTIEMINGEYMMYYGSSLITDPVKQQFIISDLKKHYPTLYENLLKDTKFKEIVQTAEKADEKEDPFKIGENNNPEFAQEHKERIYEMFNNLGFTVTEEENGIYLSTPKGKARLVAHNGYLTLDGIPNYTIQPTLYILANGKISGPYFEIKNNKITIIATQDYQKVNIFVGDYHMLLGLNGKEIVANLYDKNGNLVQKGEEVLSNMRNIIPGIVDKVTRLANPEISNLINELDKEEKVMEQSNEQVVEQPKQEQDIEAEIEELMSDPKVKRYIELMKIKEQGIASPSGPKM